MEKAKSQSIETNESGGSPRKTDEDEAKDQKRASGIRVSAQPDIPVIPNFVRPKGRMVIIV